jgi:hypothetical protein
VSITGRFWVSTEDNGMTFANKSGWSHTGGLSAFQQDGIELVEQYGGYRLIIKTKYLNGGTKNYNADATHYYVVLIPLPRKR